MSRSIAIHSADRTGSAACLVVVAWAVVTGVTPAAAQVFGRNKIQDRSIRVERVETAHVDILHDRDARSLAGRTAALAEVAYLDLATRLGHEVSVRIPVVLYASPDAFRQTNVAEGPIEEGTGGFTEGLRRRVVLPYGGSEAEFAHVLRHELAHAFTFDIVYGRRLDSIVGRRQLRPLPTWFAEGLAEHLAVRGADPSRDVLLRDALAFDLVQPLDAASGWRAYKEGQSAFDFVAAAFGAEKVAEIVRTVRRTRDVDAALERSLGLDPAEFDRRWRRWLRERYGAAIAAASEPDDAARRLTDHRRAGNTYNVQPQLAPAGDRLVLLSDREGASDILLVSALDGRLLRRLVRGAQSSRFESLHAFESSLDWSPDGTEVCFVARSGGRETLFRVEARSGRVRGRWTLDLDAAGSPAWSPDGRRVALRGLRRGQTDLFLLDLADGTLRPLTSDLADEADPCWFPDGERLIYARHPSLTTEQRWGGRDGGDLLARPSEPEPPSGYDLAVLDLRTVGVEILVATPGDERSPTVTPTGDQVLLISDAGGTPQLHRYEMATGRLVRCTNFLGGVTEAHLSAGGRRLAFTTFDHGGWDVFVLDDVDGLLGGALDLAQVESRDVQRDSGVGEAVPAVVPADTLARLGRLAHYRPRFRPDWIGGSVTYNSFYGPGGMAQFQASDLLGDHRVRAAIDVHGSLRDANALLGYYYLPRRVDLGIGIFHFRDLPGTLRPVFGEIPGDDRVFSERDVGVFGVASVPFTSFTRLDVELGVTYAKREFFRPNPAAEDYDVVATERRALTQPAFTLVHDTSVWRRSQRSRAGSRYSVSIAPTLPLGEHAVHRTSLLLDYRRYAPLGRRNSLAWRLLGGLSTGRDPLTFYLGGPTTLRGYDYLDFAGTRLFLASLEYRVPLVDAILLGWPGRWTLGDVGGVAFFDLGSAWYESGDSSWRFLENGGGLRLHDALADVGVGLRVPLAYFLLKLDFAWPTDLRTTQSVRTNFSIGFDY